MSAPLLLEIVTVLLGVVYVLLAARPSVWCWPVGIVGSALSVVLFVDARLYSEALLYVLYVVLGGVGWLRWRGAKDDRPIGTVGLAANALGVAVATVAALTLGGAMGLLTDAARPMVDAFTTSFAVWATLLTAAKARESWLYWVGIDAVSAWLYASRGLDLYAGLMLVYTVLAVVGWRRWAEPTGVAARRDT